MSEKPTSDGNPEYVLHHPGAVVDKDKAEYMAYAEKPYREEATTLGDIAKKADGDPLVDDVAQGNGSILSGWDVDMYHPDGYQYHLRGAQGRAEELADRAGERVGEAYDNIIKAQDELDRLSNGEQSRN